MKLVDWGLGLFDRLFTHFFVSSIHIFFICLSLWLGRGDLAALGVVMFIVSFAAFEGVWRLGDGDGELSEKG